MPRYPRKQLPPGFTVVEFADGTYQAQRIYPVEETSPRYTRRIKAVEWCWLKLGQEAAAKERQQQS